MDQSVTGRFPWGLLVTMTILGVVVLGLLRQWSPAEPPPSPRGQVAAVLAAEAVFLIMRWLHNSWWGLATALLLTLHPLSFDWARQEDGQLLAEALELVLLAALLAGWQLIRQPRFQVGFLVLGPVLVLCLSFLWVGQPPLGLMGSLLTFLGLALAAFLAAMLRQKLVLSWGNILATLAIALAAPALGLVAAGPCWLRMAEILPSQQTIPYQGEPWVFLQAAIDPNFDSCEHHGLAAADRERWAWPLVWVILPLMAWGWWRSLRRGWKQWRPGQMPLPWVLSLYALADVAGVVLHPASARAMFFLPLASLAVLLGVFCVADLIRGVGEHLVLLPPDETTLK